MVLRLFDKLNSPVAVILILVAILSINGFLLYQQGSGPPEEADAPEETVVETTREQAKSDEPAEDSDNAGERESTGERESEPQEENQREETTEPANGENSEEENDPPEQTEEDPAQESQDEQQDQNEQQEQGEQQDEQASGEDSGEGRQESAEDGYQGSLAGLGDALEDCEEGEANCVREFVSQVSPDSSYIGGRVELAAEDSESNAEVLYFEDPDMDACQFERGRHEVEDGLDYTVILVGPGSFEDERGEECIPTA